MYAKKTTETVFKKKIYHLDLWEIRKEMKKFRWTFYFYFETILLGRSLKVDPFDQPAVELIKTETKKNLV